MHGYSYIVGSAVLRRVVARFTQGLSDGRSLRTILAKLEARKTILVGGSDASTAALKQHLETSRSEFGRPQRPAPDLNYSRRDSLETVIAPLALQALHHRRQQSWPLRTLEPPPPKKKKRVMPSHSATINSVKQFSPR